MNYTASQIAERLGGEVIGDGATVLSGFTSADRAQAGDLTFAEKADYFAAAEKSHATAILCGKQFSSAHKTVIRVANPRVAFAKALIEKRGKVSDEEFAAVKTAGWTDANIVEMIALSAQFLLTNFMNNAVQTPIDFPEVEPAKAKAA